MSNEVKYLLNDLYLFDPNTRSIREKDNQEEAIWLGSNESNILLTFSLHANELISRERIHDLVWTDKGFHVDDSSVIQAISTLRKLLKDSVKSPSFIKTIPKQGYQFIASVEKLEDKNDVHAVSSTTEQAKHQVRQSERRSAAPDNALAVKNRDRFRFLLATIVVMLLSFSLIFESNRSPFIAIDTVDGIAVKTTKEQGLLSVDSKIISECVGSYIKSHPDKSKIKEVIVNIDSQNALLLHSISKVANNSETVTIIAEKSEFITLCNGELGE